MTERERFLATMRYQDRDRIPISDFSFRKETLVIRQEQGLPSVHAPLRRDLRALP